MYKLLKAHSLVLSFVNYYILFSFIVGGMKDRLNRNTTSNKYITFNMKKNPLYLTTHASYYIDVSK